MVKRERVAGNEGGATLRGCRMMHFGIEIVCIRTCVAAHKKHKGPLE